MKGRFILKHITIFAAVLGILALLIVGCGTVQPYYSVSDKGDLTLNTILMSTQMYPEMMEATARQYIDMMGLHDKFTIEKMSGSGADRFLRLTPHDPILISETGSGDKVTIIDLGDGQRKLEWTLEPRVQIFSSEIKDDKDDVFLIVSITFPGPVDMANTSESSGNTYIWRFMEKQLSQPLKIQAIYTIPTGN